MSDIPNPITRKDQYLSYLTGNTDYYPTDPITREEKYLYYLCVNGIGGGGGTVTPEQIQDAVDAYLEENPVSGMTEEQEEQLNQNTQDIQGKVDKNQGTSNVGKVLGIGSDGMVTPMDPPQGMTEEQIEQLNQATEDILKKVDISQGVENAGKILTVGPDGIVTPVEGTDSGGTTNYNALTNKPQINGVELSGNKTSDDLNLQPKGNYLTSETDPTVPQWAKNPTKPSYIATEVGADASGTAVTKVSEHNTAADAHSDIRLLVQGLTARLNTLADSDDDTLDQMSEIVAYIKSNKTLIDAITTQKVNVADIIDNLTTNVGNKPLSASQGVKLKGLIDAIVIPEKLPNPGTLKFTGAVTETYDGSADKTIDIPLGGESGGSGGTTNYNDLQNKPSINGVTLEGNKTGEEIGLINENQGVENAGKILAVGLDGKVVPANANSPLEELIGNYYAMRRTGKVYQTKLWKFATNPTSKGIKQLDNEGLVFEPYTDTEEGQDDYLNGQHPLFEWCHVNYIRDADGTARPIAIEGSDEYKTTGAVDVGAMQMSFWFSWDTSNAEYDLITISDTPHPELGLKPWPECEKADGTVVPWCIGSAYVSGEASDGLLRSQPNLKPARNQSHNNMITNYQQKGDGYWGAGACRNTFQFIFNAIKGATKNSQSLFAGVTNWNIQYEASIQSAENHTYFPVTNAQAADIPLGTCVSVGYGGNNSGTANNDRGQATIHEYADDVKVLRKEALPDGENTAIYLDIPEDAAFNTMPHVYDDTFSAPIILSSMHAVAGLTDSVIGHHDGSPVSNTDLKHPYRVQGREYLVGGFIVASDTVAYLNADGSRTVYTAEKGTAHSNSQETILSTYKNTGTIPNGATGTAANWDIGDLSLDEDTAAWWPSAEGSGSTRGVCDRYFAGGSGSDTLREYLQGGYPGSGLIAGVGYLTLDTPLSSERWSFLACD